MSALIGQRVFAVGGNQVYLSLKMDEYVRQLQIGSDWTRLRMGVLMAINGTADIPSADFTFGFCRYPSGIMSWDCPSFIGFGFGTTSLTTFTYVAGANPYFTHSSAYRYRIGSTSSYASSNGSPNYTACASGTLQRRSIWIVDITKGSPNYTWSVYGCNSAAQVVLDYTYNNLIEAVSQVTNPPTINGVAMLAATSGAAVGGAFNETAGALDAICIGWNRLDVAAEIYGVAVYRVY